MTEVDKTSSPVICPNCGSNAISNEFTQSVDSETELHEVQCLICDSEWIETWKFKEWMWSDGSPKMQNTNK